MEKPEVQITEPVIGIRRWNVTAKGELYSPIIEGPWERGVNLATCIKGRIWQPLHHSGPSPVDGCSCGIYAHHEDQLSASSSGVWGVIRGWGSVRVHPDGWRSEKAELLGIFSSNQDQALLEKVSVRYDVPILPPSFFKQEMIEMEFGQFVPEEIRPDRGASSKNVPMVADYILWFSCGGVMVAILGIGVRTCHKLLK